MSPASVVEPPLSLAKIDMEVLTEDDLALARLGHKQQLRRRFNIWSMLALSLCLLATWEALSTTLIAALLSGGPVSVIYGFLLAWAGTLAQAASLAEISSIYPTAGGQYHWTACLAPPGGKKWLSYVVGWASCGGLIATTASAPFACALQIQGLIGLCNPDYESKTWVVVVSFWGVLLLAGSVNIFGIRLLPAFNYLSCNPLLFSACGQCT
jgi:amino acid transporter